jgi:hypothetical protein
MKHDNFNSASPIMVVIKNAIVSMFGSISFITGQFVNIRAKGYNITNIPVLSPYGHGSIPVSNQKGLLIPLDNSNKSYVNCGYHTVIPPIPYTFEAGEAWSNSQNYVLAYQKNGIIGYRVNDNSFSATLPNGEWVGKLVSDLIADNNTTIREYINEQINLFLRTHVHSGVTTGTGVSGTATDIIPDIEPNATLAADNTAISEQKYLINDSGVNP